MTAPLPRTVGVLLGRDLRTSMSRRAIERLVVSPMIFFVGFHVIMDKLMAQRGVDFAQYLPPGIVVQSMAFGGISTAFLVAADRRSGMLDRCRTLAVHASSLVVSRLAADAVRGLIPVAVIIVAGYVTGFRFPGFPHALAFVVLAIAFGLVVCAGAAAIGYGSTQPEAIGGMVFLPMLPLINISTVFVPAPVFPDWLEPWVLANPLSAVADALRALSGGAPAPLWPALAWIAGLGTVFGYGAARAFRKERR
ncbi:ABC transporter permease [Nonomuraea sp. NPDC050663]|uniref:ABC transporter permease n=1 Tax=Nonomuraea sp. NPDC050663 TaxID=3364370 RepID=UPI0037B489CB